VDTGSTGVRILSSVLTLPLPQQTSNGNPLVNCGQFADGYTWGLVQTADVKLAGELAGSVPIQVIGGPGLPAVPDACSSSGPPENTLDSLGANGVLGIGLFRQDCGPACLVGGTSNPGVYYSCPSSGCVAVPVSLAQQLQNPVWLFGSDNNGTVIQLPAAPPAGEATLQGFLIFGIGTQPNNALGSAKVSLTDLAGNFTASFQGQPYVTSYVDAGTNGYYLLDSASTGLPVCTDAPDFYCPSQSQNVSAITRASNGTSTTIGFTISNADLRLNNLAFSVFGDIGGPDAGTIAWGLPFFYGRTVFTAIESQSTSAGQGPYWAY
jgi:hypothetical protein